MDLHLTGKRALVTGSTSGIGRGIALVLAREGVAIAVHGRNAQRASNGWPEDIGALAAYLASPLLAFVNGANYRIDGGQVQSVN